MMIIAVGSSRAGKLASTPPGPAGDSLVCAQEMSPDDVAGLLREDGFAEC